MKKYRFFEKYIYPLKSIKNPYMAKNGYHHYSGRIFLIYFKSRNLENDFLRGHLRKKTSFSSSFYVFFRIQILNFWNCAASSPPPSLQNLEQTRTLELSWIGWGPIQDPFKGPQKGPLSRAQSALQKGKI